MTHQALGAGPTTRRRVLFGLLDAEGWSWATLKAFCWFIVIILLLGYIPDRAYYFTVFSTIDIGINAISPVNLCPPENDGLPCPAPGGAVEPWNPAPQELALPAGRTDGSLVQAGTKFLYIGGADGTTATDTVFVADAFTAGTYAPWKSGPALPAPRAKAATVFLNGSIYVIGGLDASGKPTTTAFVLTPDATTGDLGTWQTASDIALPEARAGAMVVAASDGLVLLGGTNDAGQPTATVWKSTTDSQGKLLAWKPTQSMPRPRADGDAILSESYIYVYGGTEGNGPTNVVMRGAVGVPTTSGASPSPSGAAAPEELTAWWTGGGATNLPEPRTDASAFTANGALYLVGGSDGSTPRSELYWTVPDTNGNISEWKHLAVSDLPAGQGLSGSQAVVSGSDVFLVGGTLKGGVTAGAARANLAPKPPFFQLGLVGATIPALKIEGEVGQQLGYLAAAGVATTNFVILLLIGWAMAHPAQVREFRERVRRRRETRSGGGGGAG